MNATPAFQDPQSSLMEIIQNTIQSDGPIPFSNYMQTALYHPNHGYYATDHQAVGKDGDFITSVSVGRCFGLILAHRLFLFWLESGSPDTFHIIEPGSHDGSLCADILGEIKNSFPTFFTAIHYHLIEATTTLTTAQQKKLLLDFEGSFTSHSNLQSCRGLHGALLSNELIDAFPVELIRFENNRWHRLFVDLSDAGNLTLVSKPIDDDELRSFCHKLGTLFPDGYTTEYNPGVAPFVQAASEALASGLMITIDYGHSSDDLYHPDRTTGTLQTYFQHQKSDDPLVAPGEVDITTHIDFTRLIDTAEQFGFSAPSLRTQASYLTDHARQWLLDIENPNTPTPQDTPNLIRQFQTLIHPAMLGTQFHVLEMTKSSPPI